MSTKPRIVAPGVIYSISSKGVHNLDMFKKDELKTFFLEQLSKTLKKYSFFCHAFSITKNQYHLVLQSDEHSISDAMQHFNSIVAKRVNKVLKRDGTAFATRFKSVIVESDRLKNLIRSVHLEPVYQEECNIDELDSYKWSSHSVFLGNNTTEIIEKETIWKLLKINTNEEYRDFIRNVDRNDELSAILKEVNCGKQGFRKPELWIVGRPDFVRYVIELDKCRRLRIARHISENVEIEKIHNEVVRLLNLENNDLFQAGQYNVRSTARELFASICKKRYDFTGAETAQYLKITDSAVSRMISRFNKIENGDNLKEWVIAEMS